MVVSMRTAFILFVTVWSPTGADDGTRNHSQICGNRSALNDCLSHLPEILRKVDSIGIPSSKKDLDASCSAFKVGMRCVDDYSKECLTPKDRRLLDDQVAGARYTFSFLCDDAGFQSEYLQYTSCYRGISRDWDSCANRFMQLVWEEMSRRNVSEQARLLELCCAKHGFLRCVYMASRLKCRKEEALFLNKMAETLSSMRVYSPHCPGVDTALCSRSSVRRPGLRVAVAVAAAAALRLLAAPAQGH